MILFGTGTAGKSQDAAESTYQEPDTLTLLQCRIFPAVPVPIKASAGHVKWVSNAG